MADPTLISIPKSGTHLMLHVLGLTKDEGKYTEAFTPLDPFGYTVQVTRLRVYPNGRNAHVIHSDHSRDFWLTPQTIFLYRHPGDIIVSFRYHIENHPEKILSTFPFSRAKPEDQDDIWLYLLILLQDFMSDFLGWLDEDIIHIRYEDLIEQPEVALRPVATALERPLHELVGRSTHRGGDTFRKGAVGDWRREFTSRHKTVFFELYSDIVERMGYDLDY